MPQPERRRRQHRQPFVGGVPELPDQRVGRARVLQHAHGSVDVAVLDAVGGGPQQLSDLAYDDRRLLAWSPQRRPRHHGGRDQRDRAADQGVGPARERGAGVGQQRAHDDRLHRRLGHEDLAGVEQQRRAHGQRDDQRHLPGTSADQAGDQVAEEHADRDPQRHLAHPAQPLTVAGAERDHGRDRREERRVVAEHVGRHEPGDPGRDGALADLPRPHAKPPEALRQRHARPREGEVERGGMAHRTPAELAVLLRAAAVQQLDQTGELPVLPSPCA